MGNGLDIPPPPNKKKTTPTPLSAASTQPAAKETKPKTKKPPVKFDKESENEKVQFNKRVTRSTADTFDMLAIKTRRKVPELLSEAAEFLESKYGKV